MTTVTVPVLGTAHDAARFTIGELQSTDLFVCCYTDGIYAYSPALIASVLAAGKGVSANHENAQTELAGGGPAGVAAASHAVAAVIAWGTPTDGSCAIAYSVDLSVPNTPVAFEVYAAAFRQIRVVHAGRYKTGFYGELALYKYLKALGLVDTKCWLSASSSFPGWDPNDPDVGLIQTVGTDIPGTDRDLITNLDLGVWWPAGHHPSGGGTAITTGGHQMPLFHVSDGQNHTYYTDGLDKQLIVSAVAEAGAQKAIATGAVLDGSAFFPPEQVLAMPNSGSNEVTVNVPPITIPPVTVKFPTYLSTPEAAA